MWAHQGRALLGRELSPLRWRPGASLPRKPPAPVSRNICHLNDIITLEHHFLFEFLFSKIHMKYFDNIMVSMHKRNNLLHKELGMKEIWTHARIDKSMDYMILLASPLTLMS